MAAVLSFNFGSEEGGREGEGEEMIVIVATLHVSQLQASGQGRGRVATATLIFFSDIFFAPLPGKTSAFSRWYHLQGNAKIHFRSIQRPISYPQS